MKSRENSKAPAKKSRKTLLVEGINPVTGERQFLRVRESDITSAAARIYANRRKERHGGAPMIELRCVFCRKKIIGAHNKVRHERICPRNPALAVDAAD